MGNWWLAALLKPIGALVLVVVIYLTARAIWHLLPAGKLRDALYKERGSHPPD